MRWKNQAIAILFAMLTVSTTHSFAQTNEVVSLFRDLEAMDAGTQDPFDKADPVLERLVQSSRENVVAALPVVLQATSNPHLSVRRVAAMALYEVATRPDGQTLLAAQTATFTALLVDTDLPIRRVSMLAVATLRPNANSPIVPFLETYLAREDAVSTSGAFVATVLMQAAPNDSESINAVVRFMRRKDQTLESREALLIAMKSVAKSYNPEIGKQVAAYAHDPDEQMSILAIGTLQYMGKKAILHSQDVLSRIAGDSSRPQAVRAAAAKALSTAQ